MRIFIRKCQNRKFPDLSWGVARIKTVSEPLKKFVRTVKNQVVIVVTNFFYSKSWLFSLLQFFNPKVFVTFCLKVLTFNLKFWLFFFICGLKSQICDFLPQIDRLFVTKSCLLSQNLNFFLITLTWSQKFDLFVSKYWFSNAVNFDFLILVFTFIAKKWLFISNLGLKSLKF